MWTTLPSSLGAHKQDVSVRAQAVAKVFEENRIPMVWSFEEPVRKLETVCLYWGGLGYGQCMLRLKASAVMSQFRAGKTNRVDVECPPLVEPLQS